MSGRAPALDDFFGSVTNTLLDELGGDANDACWSGELGRRVEDGLVEVLIRFAETKMQEADSGGASSSVSYNPGRKSGSDPTCRLKSFGQCICVGQAYLKAVESGASPDDALQTVRSRFNRNFSPDTVINYSNVARVMRARGITVKTANYATKSGQVFVWPQVGEMLGIDTRQYRDRQEIIAAIADLAARADKDNSKRTS